MSASDTAARRAGRMPAWERAILSGHHAAALGRARQVAQSGNAAEVETCLTEIATTLQSMDRRKNGGGVWRRWLTQARRDLEWRRTLLSEAEARAEAQQR